MEKNGNPPLTEEQQEFVNQIPELSKFITDSKSWLAVADAALLKSREYYRNNPDAPPLPNGDE